MPHSWQLDERDGLEILYKEYDLDTTSENDMHAIFIDVFNWGNTVAVPKISLLRDQWRGRFKEGRSKDWVNIHSKGINAYTPQEQVRRAGVRVRILVSANTQGIRLTPTAHTAGLHAAALTTLATMGVPGPTALPPASAAPATLLVTGLSVSTTQFGTLSGNPQPTNPSTATPLIQAPLIIANQAPTANISQMGPPTVPAQPAKSSTRPRSRKSTRGGAPRPRRSFMLVYTDDEDRIVEDSDEDDIIVVNPRKRATAQLPLQSATFALHSAQVSKDVGYMGLDSDDELIVLG